MSWRGGNAGSVSPTAFLQDMISHICLFSTFNKNVPWQEQHANNNPCYGMNVDAQKVPGKISTTDSQLFALLSQTVSKILSWKHIQSQFRIYVSETCFVWHSCSFHKTGSSEADWTTGSPGRLLQLRPLPAPLACLSHGLTKAAKDLMPSETCRHLQAPFSLLLRL